MQKPIMFRGQLRTANWIAKEYCIPASTVRARIANGLSDNDIVADRHKGTRVKSWKTSPSALNDLSIREQAAMFGLSASTVVHRRRNNIPLEAEKYSRGVKPSLVDQLQRLIDITGRRYARLEDRHKSGLVTLRLLNKQKAILEDLLDLMRRWLLNENVDDRLRRLGLPTRAEEERRQRVAKETYEENLKRHRRESAIERDPTGVLHLSDLVRRMEKASDMCDKLDIARHNPANRQEYARAMKQFPEAAKVYREYRDEAFYYASMMPAGIIPPAIRKSLAKAREELPPEDQISESVRNELRDKVQEWQRIVWENPEDYAAERTLHHYANQLHAQQIKSSL